MRTLNEYLRLCLRFVHNSRSDIYGGVWAQLSANWEPIRGGTSIDVDVDERQISCYCTVRLEFSRNLELEDCEENRMLDEDNQIMPSIFEQEILPRIRKILHGPAIRMSLKTSSLTRQFDLNLLDPPPSPFPILTAGVCPYVPRIPVQIIRRQPGSHIGRVLKVHLSDYDRDWMIYKSCGLFPQKDLYLKEMLKEVEFMAQFDCAFIIRPSNLVISEDGGQERFHGYLIPYHEMGDIASLISKASTPIASSLKLKWASQIATGVAFLHERGMYWGDVKLANIVITGSEDACLIDVSPNGGHTKLFLAPEMRLNPLFSKVTGPRDIWALGALLWHLWEEFDEQSEVDELSFEWRENEKASAAPSWYRDLAHSCLSHDPNGRPTALEVRDTLLRNIR